MIRFSCWIWWNLNQKYELETKNKPHDKREFGSIDRVPPPSPRVSEINLPSAEKLHSFDPFCPLPLSSHYVKCVFVPLHWHCWRVLLCLTNNHFAAILQYYFSLTLIEMLIGVKSHSREHPFWKRGRSIHAKNPLKVSNNFTVAFTIFRGSAYQCLLLVESS